MSGTRRPIRGLLAVALVPTLMFGLLFRWANTVADEVVEGVPELSTPAGAVHVGFEMVTSLLSFRRSAVQLSIGLNIDRLAASLAPLVASVGASSCAAVSVDGRLVVERNMHTAVLPASNQKILVAAAALELLGPDFRYTTSLVGPSSMGAVIVGDVYLVGGGDPLLSADWYPESGLDRYPTFNATSLDELARTLVATGVTTIDGAVRGDGSRYDNEHFAPGWGSGVSGVAAGPYGALLVNDSRVRGDELRASDPNEAAAREFVRLLAEQGVSVTGGAATGVRPAGLTTIVSVESVGLSGVIAEMLTTSDNNTAEMLVKEIGLAASGSGTRQAGLDAITAILQAWGIDTTGMVLGDGSGLSLDNRITCGLLLAVLQHVGLESAVGDGLAIAGQTGTLAEFFSDSELNGRLRGKTGTLNNLPSEIDPPAVKSLSGFVPIDGEGAIEFVLILNGPTVSAESEYKPVWNNLVAGLESFPAFAGPAELGPR